MFAEYSVLYLGFVVLFSTLKRQSVKIKNIFKYVILYFYFNFIIRIMRRMGPVCIIFVIKLQQIQWLIPTYQTDVNNIYKNN